MDREQWYSLTEVSMKHGHQWKGNEAGQQAGRMRAQKMYPILGVCEMCASPAVERHHKDGGTLNNERTNIQFLCRHHHMAVDGRLLNLSYVPPQAKPKYCINCNWLGKGMRKGLCHTCNEYYRRNGKHRLVWYVDNNKTIRCSKCGKWGEGVGRHSAVCGICHGGEHGIKKYME